MRTFAGELVGGPISGGADTGEVIAAICAIDNASDAPNPTYVG